MQSDLLLEMGTASYVPAQLTSDSSRGWFIYYYIFNPVVGALEAKYVKLNRVKKQFRTISDEKVSTMCLYMTYSRYSGTDSLRIAIVIILNLAIRKTHLHFVG